MVQNSAARALTFNKKSAHITPILHQLHWLPVAKSIQFKLLVLVYRAHNGLAPQYLVELVQPYNLLVVPKYKLSTVGGRAFCIIGPKLWNKLPHNVRAASSLQTFKSQLKTHLFTLFSKLLFYLSVSPFFNFCLYDTWPFSWHSLIDVHHMIVRPLVVNYL